MICVGHALTDFHVPCVQYVWRTITLASFLVLLAILYILQFIPFLRHVATNSKLIRRFKRSWKPFLTLHDAQALLTTASQAKSQSQSHQITNTNIPRDEDEDTHHERTTANRHVLLKARFVRRQFAALRLTIPISFLGALEVLAWLVVSAYTFVTGKPILGWMSLMLSISWIYTFLRLVFKPTITPPYDILTLLIIQFSFSLSVLLGELYSYYAYPNKHLLPGKVALAAQMLDLAVITGLLAIILTTPVEDVDVIDANGDEVEASPEDRATLWGWMTFGFMDPLVKKGTETVLKEDDIPEVSPHHRAQPLLQTFASVKGKTLLRRIWVANSFDLLMDGLLTLISVVFNYTGPFFLKQILDAISNPTPHSIARAYVYAFLTFVCSLIKNQTDMQHLWYGRQAVTRTRSILMSAVFDKALKRKDFSGITSPAAKNGKGGKDGAGGPGGKPRKMTIKMAALESIGKRKTGAGKSGNSAGADIGKIVNLMSGDASKVSQILGQVYNLYGAPFEIVIASLFLFQLLGSATIFGFIALLSIAPLNHYLSKRRIFISRGISAARDRRMAVVNELFVSVKFIKLCAWDGEWIKRCEKARAKEMKWIMRERWNTIILAFVWTCAPILVSVFSFMAFVLQGNELTVSIAFTSIVLFNLLRQPLNVLPNFLAQLLQARVALDRIANFFSEEEVDDFVSTLKMKKDTTNQVADSTLGILGPATFIWNAIQTPEQHSSDPKSNPNSKAKATQSPPPQPGPLPGPTSVPTASGATAPIDTAHRVVDLNSVPPSPTSSDSSSSTEPRFELRDIDIVFPHGQLTLVTGPTASGKTALLLAQLGEMTMVHPSPSQSQTFGSTTTTMGNGASAPAGRILLPKHPRGPLNSFGLRSSISYAAQSPWLEHLSIRDNILFGEPFESERYWEVIEACALRTDLELLEDGDWTEIGERGISLSGGQKARVALARAVYARSQVVLLDDPLSAVDSHTARFLYERLLKGPLLKNRTVVLVTHHIELVLPAVYYYVEMEDGRILYQGTVMELRLRGILDDMQVELVEPTPVLSILDEELEPLDDFDKPPEEKALITAASEPSKDAMAIPPLDREWLLAQQAREKDRKKPRKLVEEETREIGSVKWKIYDTYLSASGYFTWVIILLLIAVSQLSGFFEKYWIKVWGEAYGKETEAVVKHALMSVLRLDVTDLFGTRESATHTNLHPLHVNPALHEVNTQSLPSPDRHPMFYVAIYGAIGVGGVIITTINTIVQYGGAVRASRLLFTRLLNSLVHATMRWHDKTPTGRILNRLSRDMEVLDSSLSNSLRAVIFRLATFFASIITVAYVFPLFLVPATIISYFYWRISKGYINAGRDMRRMQSTTRSPIFAGFAETLEGIVTVRAFGVERKFLETLLQKIDLTTKMWYGFWMINRWLLLRFDALGALSIFIITLFALSGYISGGWAGITITSAMQFTVSVYWTCRLATQLELDLNSVERVVEYLDLPQEPPRQIEGKEVPAYWPSTATITSDLHQRPLIQVEDLVIRYAPELPPVLTGVSFSLRAGEKVGLLGRTGSGKSTLAMSLLRFVDPSEGRIVIDGVDICSIGLNDLRSRVTIIPQDSVLFSGSLRENLDPFEEHTDSECLDALYRVHLLTPGARVRKPTSSVDLGGGSRIRSSILERALTPEPEGMNTEESNDGHEPHDKSRLMPSDTLLAPVLDHTGGMVTPNRMGTLGGLSSFGFGGAQLRLQTSERDMPNFRFGGGMESGAISPTGAFSPVGAAMNPSIFGHTVRFRMTETDSPAPASEPVSRPAETENENDPETESARARRRAGSGTDTGDRRKGTMGTGRSRGGSGAVSRDGDGDTTLLTLDTRVASGGANFSSGQRQLVSMARALLRRNAVVILDEATSSIDFETDAKIQQTVREEFRSSCLLTIAHRIRTVIDYDRLIILDKGKIVEFDTPWNLIQRDGGVFRDMCLKSGQMRELEQMAKAQSLSEREW